MGVSTVGTKTTLLREATPPLRDFFAFYFGNYWLSLGGGTSGLSSCSNISIKDLIGFAAFFISVSRYASLFPSIFSNPRCLTSFSPAGVAAMAYHFWISYCLSNESAHLIALLMIKCPRSLSLCLSPVWCIDMLGM